jgi:hypothetical protein
MLLAEPTYLSYLAPMKAVVARGPATCVMPVGVNDTTVVLIPKKDEPEMLKDFWPILLCNVVYKVVSKCMVNRLRPLL